MTTSTSPDPTSDPSRRTTTPPAPGWSVVESEAWLRSRLCDLLQTEPRFWLAGVAERAEKVISMAERERFDIAVVGHRPPSESGFKVCRELKWMPTPPVVVICCAYPDGVLTAACAVAEIEALVSICDSDAELAGVLDRVARGARFLPSVPPRVGAMLHERLDPAEHAIFSMLLAGLPTADVARGLRMSQAELESRRSALLGKLETLPASSGVRC
jgi:two-component system response regulator DevR